MSGGTGELVRTVARGLGQTLITAGVVVLLFCVYLLQVTGLVTEREQSRLGDELRRTWASPPAVLGPAVPATRPVSVAVGEGMAVLRIPRLGDDHAVVVVHGTGVEDLKKGPGHMVETALPGELGNAVLSGHRTTYGAPFGDIDRLEPGDPLVVETRDTWFTYRVTGSEVVRPTDVEVALPVPGQPGATPTKRLLTLTTCHPRFSARQRLIVYSELTEALPKSQGTPGAVVPRV